MPFMSIPIAMGIAGAGSAASSIYGAKRAADTNKRSIDAQTLDAREERASQERMMQARMAADQQRWNDYVRVHEPHWQMGSQVLGSLYDMAGVPRGSAPPSAGMPPPQAPSGSPGGMQRRPTFQPSQSVAMPRPGAMSLDQMMALANDYGRG